MRTIDTGTLNMENVDRIRDSLLLLEDKEMNVIFSNGSCPLKRKYIILSMFFWRIMLKWNIPITIENRLEEKPVDNDYIAKYGTLIIDEVKRNNPDPKIINNLNYDLWILINELMNFSIRECQEYVSSVSVLDLAIIKRSDEVKEIIKKDIDLKKTSIINIESTLLNDSVRLYDALKRDTLTHNNSKLNNVLFPLTSLRFINVTQLHHIFNAIGFRTDIDDSIVSYPIMSGYLDGIQNDFEYMVESLSAKKSAFYTMKAIPTAQYFLRKQHLLVSAISKIYSGDCGSRLPLEFMITEKNANNVIWKNIILKDNTLLMLTPDNIKNYIGDVVNLKSVCNHTDGICEACGGKYIEHMPRNINIGVFSSMQVADPVVQRILSDKHFQQTMSVEYEIPPTLKFLLSKSRQNLYFRDSIKGKTSGLELGFVVVNVKKILNIANTNINSIDSINEISFGDIQTMFVRNKGKLISENEIKMSHGRQAPYFSKEFILYIKKNQDMTKIENNVLWVSLEKFIETDALFRTNIINDSMVKFVNSVKQFIESEIKTYTSMEKALRDFSELIYHKVNMPIVFVEIMIRAYMVKNSLDLNIPVVVDPKNVMFNSNMNINQLRSFGGLFAFERLGNALTNPSLYLVPKKRYMFDYYLNYKPRRSR